MKKMMIIFLVSILTLVLPSANASAEDCEYFVLPELGINEYTLCLQNPDNYSEYFIYHTVNFYDGAVLLASHSVRDGDSVTVPTSPEKDGYDFTGWSESTINVKSDINIYAEYLIQGPTITYLDYDGTLLKQENVAYGGTGTPPDVSREGYDFDGWSGSYQNVTADVTLIASYSIQTFAVRFFDLDSNLLKSEVVNYNGSVTPPEAPVESGKTFVGWSQGTTNIDSNRDIFPVYEEVTYTVTFMADDVIKVEEVAYGGFATAPTVTKEGYTFTGWDRYFVYITEDIVVNAIFEPKTFIVSFQDGLGTILHTEHVEYMQSASPPLYEREGYNFLGWNANYTEITYNIIIFPVLEEAFYHITMIDYDGSIYLEEDVPYGGNCTEVTPVREGYRFVGLSEDCTNVKEDKTVTLLYEPLVYTVKFYDGDVLVHEELVNQSECANEPDVSREGHTFTGWDVEFCNVQSDIEIHAQYEAAEYVATFLDYDGTVLGTRTAAYGESVQFPEPKRTGYHFTGWSDSLIIKNNITLVAKYTQNRYTVVFKYLDNVLLETYVRHGGSVTPPEAEIEGKSIVGWSHNTSEVYDNMIVMAITENNVYKVTFMDYDMNLLEEQKVEYGNDAIPPSPTRDGYEFVGWSDSYENITNNITLIAEYKGIDIKVRYVFNNEVIKELEIDYGTVPPQLNGYTFESGILFGDTEIELTEICQVTYTVEGEETVYDCGVTPIDPIKDGYVFDGWEETEIGYEALFSLDEYEVTFIVGDYMEVVMAHIGELPSLSTFLRDNNVEWDQDIEEVTTDITYTGYMEPEFKPDLNIEYADGVYLFDFNIDISEFELMYLIVDGELRTIDDYYVEKDKTSLFDRTVDWYKVHIPEDETLERVYFSDGTEYRYTIEDHMVESDVFTRIFRWVQSIFS